MGFWAKLFGKQLDSAAADEMAQPATGQERTDEGEPKASSHRPPTAIEWKQADGKSTSFVAELAVAQIMGTGGSSQKSVTFMYEGEVPASTAHAARVERWRQDTPELGTCTRFTDNMFAVEYVFPDDTNEETVLNFCRVFANCGVRVALANKISQATQKKILACLGMQQGMAVQ